MKKHFIVVSPEYEAHLFNGIDPPEYGCDVVSIEAENKKDAKSFALRTKDMEGWLEEARRDRINPFSGLKVEEPLCEHGVCYCGCIKTDEIKSCPKCDYENAQFEDEYVN